MQSNIMEELFATLIPNKGVEYVKDILKTY